MALTPNAVLYGPKGKDKMTVKKVYTKRAPSQAAKIAKLQKQVNSMIKDREIKSFDTALAFNIDGTGEIPATGQLCLIPQGATAETRNGAKCVIKSIQIRASIGMVPAAAGTASSTAHMFIVQDRMCPAAAATVAQVFTSTNLALALRNITNYSRFTILKHWWKTFTPTSGATGNYNNEQYAFEFYKKVNIPLEFNATAGAVTELTRNNIFIIAGTDGASDDIMSVAGTCRVCFDDGL